MIQSISSRIETCFKSFEPVINTAKHGEIIVETDLVPEDYSINLVEDSRSLLLEFRRGNSKRGLVSRRKDETIIAGTVRRHRFNACSADL